MKELYLEITFWIGAITLFGLLLVGFYKVFAYLINSTTKGVGWWWNFYEFMIYRKEFDEFVKDKQRHPKSIK